MKIRIKANTVRYRLSKSEVAKLAEKGILEERTEFINGSLTYAIKQTDKTYLSADFFQNNITLFVPQKALQQWANTEQIGLENNMALPDGKSLFLLLEKDFKCNDAVVNEDQSDYFENPQLTC
jgi:hypothetical protein